MAHVTPPEDPVLTDEPDQPAPAPTIEQADVEDDPAYDEVDIVDTDEFGEPVDGSQMDDDDGL